MNPKNTPCSPCKNKHSAKQPTALRTGESLRLEAASGATADGQNINQVTATLTRGTEYVSGELITLKVASGSAVFTNGEKTYEDKTTTLGTVTTALTDTVAETVDILASYAPASETELAQSTFVVADLDLLPPVIEGVSNSELWVADLADTVLIDIFHWSSIADGDIVVLTLSGEDASGLSVEDVTEQHTVGPADLTQQKLVMSIGKDRIRPFGANGHPGETGSLTLRYTVNGVRSPENVFTVHSDGGGTGTTYTVTADIVVNNANANGTDSNVVTWSAVDENGEPVTNLSGTATVDGYASINNTGSNVLAVTSMPVTLRYQNNRAQTVTASLILDDNAGSGEARLTFGIGCQDVAVMSTDYLGHDQTYSITLIDAIKGLNFVAGKRYSVTVQARIGGNLLPLTPSECSEQFAYVAVEIPGHGTLTECKRETIGFIPEIDGDAAVFTSPATGVLDQYFTPVAFGYNFGPYNGNIPVDGIACVTEVS